MGRAQPKSSPTDEHARRIARALATGRPPPLDDDLERYCGSSPREVFAAFAGAARHMPPGGKDAALALGYVVLLQRLLEHLRYRTDCGHADAAKLIAEFQAHVAAQVAAGRVDDGMLAYVGGALHQSKIPASPALAAATAKLAADHAPASVPVDVRAALAGMLESCGGDPFTAVGMLAEATHAMPVENRVTLAGALALCGVPEARGVAVLLLLDESAQVRGAVAAALAQVAGALTPTEVRRLIAMRNWRPERERGKIDAIVRTARAGGIECACWDAGGVEKLAATAIDGAMAQALVLVSPAGRKKRMSSILFKGGIADAWSGEPEPLRRLEATLAGMHGPILAVSRAYVDRTVAHHLAIGSEAGQAPPFGLLQVAETIGGADWQPARMDFAETLAGLMSDVPKPMCEPAAVASLLRRSGELADLEVVAQPWFEDDPAIAETVERARGGDRADRAKLAAYLLAVPMQPHRHKWAELFLRTALWMREASPSGDLCWRELAIVAKALADGRDMSEIGLMRDIALRTIAVLDAADPARHSAFFPGETVRKRAR
ncbi:MAG TPA: hypothetical protein VII40_06020 [Xanthobacteraceae bacterium]